MQRDDLAFWMLYRIILERQRDIGGGSIESSLEMKIYLLALFYSFGSLTSAAWWLNFGSDDSTTQRPTSPPPRDCTWQDWIVTGLCLEVTGKHFKYGREETRYKIEEKNGGKPCVGAGTRIVECTEDEYHARLFQRTVAAVTSGGGTSRRTIIPFSRGDNARRTINAVSRKCTPPLKNADGNIVAAGSYCAPLTRKKRRVVDSLQEMRRRVKRGAPPVLSTKNRDVLFLLDESGSVGPSNFKLVIRMAKALVNSFCGAINIGKSQTRVGVLSFNREQHPAINFDKYFDKAILVSNMDKEIKYYGSPSDGATCLVDALNFAKNEMLTKKHGARIDVAGTERVVILITDGCANCKSQDTLKADLEKKGTEFTTDGVPIITFLIADDPSHCFNLMKGLSYGSKCYQQFSVKNWAGFLKEIEIIEKPPCMDAWMIGRPCPP